MQTASLVSLDDVSKKGLMDIAKKVGLGSRRSPSTVYHFGVTRETLGAKNRLGLMVFCLFSGIFGDCYRVYVVFVWAESYPYAPQTVPL